VLLLLLALLLLLQSMQMPHSKVQFIPSSELQRIFSFESPKSTPPLNVLLLPLWETLPADVDVDVDGPPLPEVAGASCLSSSTECRLK
jgi:hypothetical protein